MSSHRTARTIFYPMAGSSTEQLNNLLKTLDWIDTNTPMPVEVYKWLRSTFGLSHYFARNIYTVLLITGELVDVHNERCLLTRDGRSVLETDSPETLLNIFEQRFVGLAAVLEVLRHFNNIPIGTLQAIWYEMVKERFPKLKNWSKGTFSGQLRHRINWLRAMGFITIADKRYSLSENGWQFVITHPPEAIALQPHEIKKEEKRLRETVLGSFQPFDLSAEKVQSLRRSFVRARAFRKIVTAQYDYHCAICGFRLGVPRGIYEAEAAHIIPRRLRGSDDPRNGICLCGVHHWAFDEGVVSVRAENLTIMTATYLEKEKNEESVRGILQFKGKCLERVLNHDYSPSSEALDWHNERIFLG